jgi:hypothetical protein
MKERVAQVSAQEKIYETIVSLQQSGQATEIQNAFENKRRLDEVNYHKSIRQMALIERMTVRNHPMFSELEWDFSDQVNVILGRNGYGKTLTLKILTSLLSSDVARISDLLGGPSSNAKVEISLRNRPGVGIAKEAGRSLITCEGGLIGSTIAPIPVLAIPDIRSLNRVSGSVPEEEPQDLARHGYRKLLYDQPISAQVQWRLNQAYIDYIKPPPKKPRDIPLLNLIEETISSLSGTRFEFRTIESTGSTAQFRVDVVTEAQLDPVPLQVVSQGTLSVVAIVCLIYDYLRVVAQVNRIPRPQDAPGLVIIDEIDAHLHPMWQTSIVDLLRERFPNVQFIFAAHSPLVVAGSLANEVCVLRRDAGGKFEMQNIYTDFIGWRAEEILHKVFNVEDQDPTYNRYSAMAPRRGQLDEEAQKLLRKGTLSEEEAGTLQRLQRDIHYIDRAHAMQQRRSQEEYLRARALQMQEEAYPQPPDGQPVP